MIKKNKLTTEFVKTNWKQIIDHEIDKQYLNEINQKIESGYEVIYPSIENIFNAFNFFNIEETKIVIFGQDPYHGEGEANGLAFSVNDGIKLPPSLKNIFKKIKMDFDIEKTSGDLSNWAQQGVLLLNTCLTVKKDCARSHHNLGWEIFTKNIIDTLNNNQNQILFVLWGNDAKSLAKYINTNKHLIVSCGHPSPLSANRGDFFSSNCFKKIAEFYKNNFAKEFKW